MAITQWQEKVARRVRQFILEHYYAQPNEFESKLESSSYSAYCSWWALDFANVDNGLFNNTSIRVLVVSFPEDLWELWDESIEFRVEFGHKFYPNIPNEKLEYIRQLVIQRIENCGTDWKVVEDDGIITIKYYLNSHIFGGEDDEMSQLLLEMMIAHTLKIADCYLKFAQNIL